MSLLQQDSTELDDAAKGEELTKGSSHVVLAAIAATFVVALAIAIYVIAGQKPPIATAQIVSVWAHPQHTETSGLDASGAPMPKEIVDQVMVFTRVSIHNQTDHPLFLVNLLTNVTLPDGMPGFIRKSELSRDRAEQRPDRFAVGQKVDARVIQYDRRSHKVTVSIKALEVAEEKEAIAQYGSSDSGATLGDILGTALRRKGEEGDKGDGKE